MKIAWVFLLALILVNADVRVASTSEDVNTFLQEAESEGNIAALFFFDSSLHEENTGGFWSGVVTSVSNIFSGEDEEVASGQKVSEIEQKISDEADLIQIDVSNEDLRLIQEQYDVTTVPFLIIFKNGVIVLKEVPTHETHDKVLDILEINTDTSSEEPEVVEVTAEEVTEESATETQEVNLAESPAPVANVAPVRINQARAALHPREREITLAPGQRRRPVHREQNVPSRKPVQKPQEAPKNTEIDREYVHKRCHDVTTPEDQRGPNWRSSPAYISNLEDYEIPEDWWKNGYTPIEGNDTESSGYTRKVKFTEDESILFEPTDIVVRPTPVRPAPVRPHVVAPQPIPRPTVRPSVVQARLPHVARNATTTNSTSVHAAARATVKPSVAPVRIANSTVSVSNHTAAPVKRAPVASAGTRVVAPGTRHTVQGTAAPRVVRQGGNVREVTAPHAAHTAHAGTAHVHAAHTGASTVRHATNTTAPAPSKR